MLIGPREVGPGHPTFIVAELSANHAGSLDRARALVREAAQAGADAVKFQCYAPADLTLDTDHPAYRLTAGPWAGRTLHELYAEAQTPREWLPELFDLARASGLVPFASVFSLDGLAFLETLDCPAYKIASAEVECAELVEAVAATGKPVILSDGVADEAMVLRMAGHVPRHHRAILRCVAEYPADAASYRLGALRRLAGMGVVCGVSDHTTGTTVPVAAVACGANVVEKHIMLYPHEYDDGPPLDEAHSSTPQVFHAMVRAIRETEAALAGGSVLGADGDVPFRRRLVFARDMEAGDVVTPADVRLVRCGAGLTAADRGQVVGRVVAGDVEAGEPVGWEAFVWTGVEVEAS